MKTHITRFGIENFRVFNKMQNFNFAPITILTGTNSSGKSTLTKSIMILKESMNKCKLSKLEINAPYLKIGGYAKNLNKIENENMHFKFEYIDPIPRQDFEGSFKVGYNINKNTLLLGYDINGIFKTEFTRNDNLVFFWENFKQKYSDKINDSVKWKLIPVEISFNSEMYKKLNDILGKEILNKLTEELYIYIQETVCCNEIDIYNRDLFLVLDILKDSIKSILDDNIVITFYDIDDIPCSGYQNELPKLYDIISTNLKSKIPDEIQELFAYELIDKITLSDIKQDTISSVLNQIHYIAGLRAKQEIVFTIDEYPLLCEVLNNYTDYLKKGSEINLIWSSGVQKVKRKKYSFLEKWLVDEFKMVNYLKDLIITPIDGYGLVVKINSDMSLNQVGYGFTQLLPLILQVVFLEHNVFIIEEPESNLHPALQSKLADFFTEAAKEFDIQFIIETHSEYLIRKLQYLTAKKEIKSEETQLYYFYPPNDIPAGEQQVYPINIMEDGSLSRNFGKGFFDEADNIALELFLLNNNQSN